MKEYQLEGLFLSDILDAGMSRKPTDQAEKHRYFMRCFFVSKRRNGSYRIAYVIL